MEVTFNYANSEPDEVDQDCMIRFICKMIAERKKDPVYMAGFEQWKTNNLYVTVLLMH